MNRLTFFAVALSLVFTIANAQSELDTDISEEPTTVTDNINENLTKLDLTNKEFEAREDEMATEMAYMITFITKSLADISKITENMKSMSNKSNIDEASMKNLVNHLVSFKEDDNTMEDQIKRVLEYRQQFKSAILKYLKNMPIDTEDAKLMEKELRNQMKKRLPNIPISENIMDLPASMQNMLPN
ncbi:PREDICTED: uncharacterized protein LOC107163936 [Diuraphis noxia]|uniref:uncharacterized protein LOC107163936 n=1 Tax=Diuraphis noxia TaxID=143948 RepID=UPI00076385FD|nr:PREDICTED: uncharacterized protein LOC107163936 [Diuraphis noxia]